MKKESLKMRFSWTRIEALSAQLARKIKASGFQPDHLIGIAMGGLIPLALVARELGVKSVSTVSARSYDEKTKKRGKIVVSHIPRTLKRGTRVLLVDEITDTGETLAIVSKILRDTCGAKDIKTATLVVNKARCRSRPDFSAMLVDRWVVFPWEEKPL